MECVSLLSLYYCSPLNSFLHKAKDPHLVACPRNALETWDMTILLQPIFLQHLYKGRGGRWSPLPSPLFLGLINPLLTYHFASRWIPSVPRCTEPELHWIQRQAVWFQLKYCGFSPIWGAVSIPIPLPALAQLLPTSVPSKGLIFSAGSCFLPMNLLGQFPSSSQCQQNYTFLTAPVLYPQGCHNLHLSSFIVSLTFYLCRICHAF